MVQMIQSANGGIVNGVREGRKDQMVVDTWKEQGLKEYHCLNSVMCERILALDIASMKVDIQVLNFCIHLETLERNPRKEICNFVMKLALFFFSC